MRITPILTPVLIAGLLATSGCLSDEPVIPYDDGGPSSTGVVRSGADWVEPRGEWSDLAPDDLVVFEPAQEQWPELPRDLLLGLEAGLTESELIALLGEPRRKEVRIANVDRPGADWNAWWWSWRYQDSTASNLPVARDLEVRLRYVSTRDTALGLDEHEGPVWVVSGFDLY